MATFKEYQNKVDPDGALTTSQVDWLKSAYSAGVAHGRKPKKTKKPTIPKSDLEACIDYYNEKAGKRLGYTPNNLSWPRKRLEDGYTVEQLCLVVDYTVSEWTNATFGGTPAKRFIRPQTIWISSEKMDLHLADWEAILEERAPIEVTNAASKDVEEIKYEQDNY